jgi:hypothetical protein
VSVTLTAPVTAGTVLLAVALAIVGGWRATRLRPAAALGKVA